MIAHRSRVAGVHHTVPEYPSFTRNGSLPAWSMWAWERITPLRRSGGNGSRAFFSRALVRCPWNMPQSSATV
jgi:hypothetical protein